MNTHFKWFFKKKLCRFEFLDQYDKLLNFFHEKEIKIAFKSRNSTPCLVIENMFREAATVYTRVMYQELTDQFMIQIDSCIELMGSDNSILTYK